MPTIDDAIENIKEVLKLDCHIKYSEWQDALQLGIEALKRLQEGRKVDHAFAWKRLPGETKE